MDGAPIFPAQPRRRWRGLRLTGVFIGGLLAAVVVSDLLGWFYLRLPAQWLASRALEREVRIAAPLSMHLLRREPSLAVGALWIAAPAWSEEAHFVDLQQLEARVGWKTLTGGPVDIRHLGLVKGDVRAVRLADGRATWPERPGDEGKTREPAAALPAIAALDVGELTVKLVDEAQQLTLAAEARTEARAEADREGVAALRAKGDGSWREQPFGFDLFVPRILEVASTGSGRELVANGHVRSTTLRFEGAVKNLFAADGIDGRISVDGNSLGDLSLVPGVTLPDTPPFRLEARLQRDAGHLNGEVTRAEIGSSRLTATFDYTNDEQPPMLRGKLDASRLVLQDLGPAIGAEGGKAAGPAASARVLPDRDFDVPGLKAMNADFAIDLRQLDLGTEALRPLTAVRARLRLDDGLLSLDDLQAAVAGGRVSGNSSLDTRQADRPPVWKADLDWRRVDLRRWIRAGDRFVVAGRFSGKTRLEGQGQSTAALLGSLDGDVRGRIDGGSISHLILEAVGLDVGQAIGVLFKGSEPLALSCALIDLGAKDGRLQTNALVLNTRDTLLMVDGRLNFHDESLAVRIVPAPKDWSPFSLRTPIRIAGTLDKPQVSLEPRPLALKVLAGLVLGTVTPVAALIPFIEPAVEKTGDGCAPAIQAVQQQAKQRAPADGGDDSGDEGEKSDEGDAPDEKPVEADGREEGVPKDLAPQLPPR